MKLPPRLRIVWTCGDLVHHEHKTKLGAYMCGRVQRIGFAVRFSASTLRWLRRAWAWVRGKA